MLRCIMSIALIVCVGMPSAGIANEFKEGGKEVGEGFKRLGKATGKVAKDSGKAIGKGFKKAGKETGKAMKEMGKEVGSAFRKGGGGEKKD